MGLPEKERAVVCGDPDGLFGSDSGFDEQLTNAKTEKRKIRIRKSVIPARIVGVFEIAAFVPRGNRLSVRRGRASICEQIANI